MDTGYQVALDVFEGPLDLLLHLVKKHELSILDIPIAFVTQKYLEYLDAMAALDIDVAGEYLLMAATLCHIKSRELLPSPEPLEDEGEPGEEDGVDPRADLIKRLLEYQRYREAALALGERPVLTRDVFRRDPAVPDHDQSEGIRLRDVTVADLLEAFREVMERALRESFHEIVHEDVSVDECVELIVRRMEMDGALRFRDLFAGSPSRRRMVATFLALLELVKRQFLQARQEEDGAEILLFPKSGGASHLDDVP